MTQDLALFLQLLIFLTGTLLYGFLARELWLKATDLAGWPMRLLATCLAVWYAGCFGDEILGILLPDPARLGRLDTALDLLRGLAWLLSFPLLSHAIWSRLGEEPAGGARRPAWGWLVPGYLTLLGFLPAAVRAWQSASVELATTARAVFPLVLGHAAVGSAASAGMLAAALRQVRDPGLLRFLRWLLGALGLTLGLLVAGGLALGAGGWGETLWRLAAESSGLVLGVTFLYFVQRYNLLQLSLSFRSLRRFAALLAAVALVMLVGPAMGVSGTAPFHHFVAWGLLLALLASAASPSVERAAARRSLWLRRLLSRGIAVEEIEELGRSLLSLATSEAEMRALTAATVGRWLAASARWLPPGGGPAGPILAHFEAPGTNAFNRLDAPSEEISRVLQLEGLQAAFPLRAGGRLEGVLVLAVGPAGGGYQEGEMEGARLALAQLAAALELGRLVEERLAVARRAAERERLSLLGLVAASLAHELKNPLSAMKALAQTVHEELAAAAPEGDQARDLALIVEQIDRLHGVAREILGLARPPEGSEGSNGGVDLTPLLRSTLYVMGHRARQRGLEIDAREVAEVGWVAGTGATWQTVLLNLLGNALEHSPPGGRVALSLFRCEGRVVLAIRNGGPAIPQELAARLFSLFAEGAAGDAGRGTGLGLRLVAERVGELGGAVELSNEPERIVFTVRVPDRGVRPEEMR